MRFEIECGFDGVCEVEDVYEDVYYIDMDDDRIEELRENLL
jgi:hypothetical protein